MQFRLFIFLYCELCYYKYTCFHFLLYMNIVLLGIYLGVEFWGNIIYKCPALGDNVKRHSEVLAAISIYSYQ